MTSRSTPINLKLLQILKDLFKLVSDNSDGRKSVQIMSKRNENLTYYVLHNLKIYYVL